jgi:hypothetical protein
VWRGGRWYHHTHPFISQSTWQPRVVSSNDSLITTGWTGDKPCNVTIVTRASVTIARPDITACLRKLSHLHIRQTASRKTILVLKDWWSWLWAKEHCEFGCHEEFILGRDFPWACNTVVDLKHMCYHWVQVFSCCPRARSRSSLLVLTSNEVIYLSNP